MTDPSAATDVGGAFIVFTWVACALTAAVLGWLSWFFFSGRDAPTPPRAVRPSLDERLAALRTDIARLREDYDVRRAA